MNSDCQDFKIALGGLFAGRGPQVSSSWNGGLCLNLEMATKGLFLVPVFYQEWPPGVQDMNEEET